MGFNYGEMMKQAKIMQKQMEKVQEELKDMKFEASAGGGAVKVTVNGEQDVLEVKINKDVADPDDIEMLEDMVLVAVNDAIKQSKDEAKNKLAGVTGGLNIPGF
ncbi:MAG: YbaB/EbfC family nucleoid-associated protein [Actinobacteria bacterium]|nr:YbaB/EbfC family nucleoid-associated protein [Actinomycetota bacterium]MBU4450015.1 YbaB/EbfC family nucleoid-associated protein [Actinomycetota bacterium]MCG2788426.1 YbaB/EbfC family nucleoid-associated protein [Actinomycetes bacterium]